MNREFGIPLAAALLCLAGRVEAQTQSGAGDPVGENHASIEGSVVTTYDTDVPRSDAELAHLRGLQQVDESVRPDVEVDLLKAIGEQSVFLRGSAGYTFYDRDHILDSEQLDLTGGADLRVGACHGVLSDEILRHENNLEQAIVDTAIVKNIQTLDTASLSAGCTRAIGFSPTGSVSASWSDNANPLLRTTDYQTLSGKLGVAYDHPSLGHLSLYGSYNDTEYINRFVSSDATGTSATPSSNGSSQHDGFDLYAAGVHFDRNIGSRLTGSLDVTYTTLSQNDPGARGFSGVNYSIDLNAHATSRLSATFHAERSVRPSLQLGSNFIISDRYAGEVDYLFSERITFALGATQVNNDNAASGVNNGAPGLIPVGSLQQTLSDVYGQGRLQFARRFSLTLDVRGENSTASPSEFAEFNYNSMRVTLTLSGKY